jgi:hypothetical protein
MVLRYFGAAHRKIGKDRKVQTQSITRMTRIYTYPRVSASSAQSAFQRRLSAFICVHLRLIYVSLSDRTQKIQFEQFTMMRNFLLYPGFSKQNIMKSPWRGDI